MVYESKGSCGTTAEERQGEGSVEQDTRNVDASCPCPKKDLHLEPRERLDGFFRLALSLCSLLYALCQCLLCAECAAKALEIHGKWIAAATTTHRLSTELTFEKVETQLWLWMGRGLVRCPDMRSEAVACYEKVLELVCTAEDRQEALRACEPLAVEYNAGGVQAHGGREDGLMEEVPLECVKEGFAVGSVGNGQTSVEKGVFLPHEGESVEVVRAVVLQNDVALSSSLLWTLQVTYNCPQHTYFYPSACLLV